MRKYATYIHSCIQILSWSDWYIYIYICIILNEKGSVSNIHHLRWRTHCTALGFAWGTLIFWKQYRTAAAPRQRWCVRVAEIITEIRYVERETGERNISPNKKKRIEIIERFYTLYLYVYLCVCVFLKDSLIFWAGTACVCWGSFFIVISPVKNIKFECPD